jgi:hypothetical protein
MRIIQSVAPDMSVCLTNDNRLVIMVEDEDGEHLAEITDMDKLIQAVRRLDQISTEPVYSKDYVPVTTAEAEQARRQEVRYDQYIREGAPGSYDQWLHARLFG